jgi:chemotaxis protein CheD
MDNPVIVGISDMNVTGRPGVLVTYALGSCVGICLYDRLTGLSGLSHVLLPAASMCPGDRNLFKFADTAVQALIARMESLGANRVRLTAKIAGGANLFRDSTLQIGERNVAAVKSQLAQFRIPIVAEDTGRDYGRTVEFHAEDGAMVIKTALRGLKII